MNRDLNIFDVYCDDVEQIELLSKEEEEEFYNKYLNGDVDARNKLVINNLKLIRKLVGKYKGKNISIADITQDLSLYLFKILENYDPSKGCKLSTYAQTCLEYRLIECVDKEIKNPLFTRKDRLEFNTINKFYYSFANKNGHFPDIETISMNTDISSKRIRYLLELSTCFISYDTLVNELELVEEEEYIDKKPDYLFDEVNTEDNICKKLDYELLKKKILSNQNLTQTEKRNIRMMYGFDDNIVKTFREVGNIYNISGSAVEGSIRNGIKKIKSIPFIKEYE